MQFATGAEINDANAAALVSALIASERFLERKGSFVRKNKEEGVVEKNECEL